MRTQTVRALLVALACGVPSVLLAQQIDGRPMPDFTVMAADGRETAGQALSTEPQWLLIYVSPESAPSHRLLRLMKDWQIAGL